MSVELTTHAVERSTYILDAQFSNASGTTFVPTTVSWTLSDRAGTDQNGRTDVSATAATTVTLVLSGSDLTLVAVLMVKSAVLAVFATASAVLTFVNS